MRRPPAPRAVATVALAGTVLAVAAVALVAPAASAAGSFTVRANAYPVQTSTTNATVPIGFVLEGYGSYARTNLDSLGSSDSLAGAPYPGDVAAGASGLVQSVTGLQVPDYPFFVVSAAGDDPKDRNYPGSTLHVESRPAAAIARAVQGDDAAGATAVARSEALADGSVQATAESTQDAVQLGANLTMRGLRTFTRVTADGSTGKLKREASLEFASLVVPGLNYQTPCKPPPQFPPLPVDELPCTRIASPEFAFRDGRFFVRSPNGTEQQFPVPADSVLGALAAAGIKASYQKPQNTATGLVGAGMIIDYEFPPAPPNPSGIQGPTFQRVAFGFSTVSTRFAVVPGAFEGFNPGGTVNPGGVPSSDPAAAVPTGGFSGGSPGSLGDIGAVPAPSLAGGPSISDVASLVGSPGAPTSGGSGSGDGIGTTLATAPLASPLLGDAADLSHLYLLLVGTAVLAYLSVSTYRLLGVRARWIS